MNTGIYYIEFNGVLYPSREIFFENKWNMIATTELSNNLFDNEAGKWVSEEARKIDEKILFFIEPDQISLPDKEIIKIIRFNIQ